MKKLLALLISVCMLLSLPVCAAAEEQTELFGATESSTNFGIEESVDEYGRVTRIYRAGATSNRTAVRAAGEDYSEVKAILEELGMNPEFIEALTEEELQFYATCVEISCGTAYFCTDEAGNVCCVDEETALIAAEEINTSGQDNARAARASYVEVEAFAAHQGSGRYMLSVTADWLTTPSQRYGEAIGVCASSMAIETSGMSGFYSYDFVQTINNVTTTKNDQRVSLSSSAEFASVEGWAGGGAAFTFPKNVSVTGGTLTYSDFRAYFSCFGNVTNPTLATNFNVMGSYSHATVTVSGDVAVVCSLTNSEPYFCVGIEGSLTLVKSQDKYKDAIYVSYTP